MSVNDVVLTYKTRSGFMRMFEYTALGGVSFELKQGETLGVLGRNGSGKSSLLRVLAGLIMPTSGNVVWAPGSTRALLSIGVGFRPDLSGRDNAMLGAMLQGASRAEALSLLPGIRAFCELGEFFEQPVKTYSSGMKSRLGFATAMAMEVDILLIDEILSVGDSAFKKKAEGAMRERISGSQSVVFVSHNIDQIEKLCDRVIWLSDGRIKEFGETNTVLTKYEALGS